MSRAHWNSAGGGSAPPPPPPQPNPDPGAWRSAAAWSVAESAAAGDPASLMHPAVAASSRKRKGSAQQSQQPQPSHGHFTDAASGSPAAPAASSSSSAPLAEGAYSTCQLTLGLEVSGKLMHPIVPRGTRLPCTSTQLFSTYADQQQYVSIMVYQVSRSHAHTHTHTHTRTHTHTHMHTNTVAWTHASTAELFEADNGIVRDGHEPPTRLGDKAKRSKSGGDGRQANAIRTRAMAQGQSAPPISRQC